MAERRNADLFEVLIGQVWQDREIDIVLCKALGVLGQAELFEPVRDLLHPALSAGLHKQFSALTRHFVGDREYARRHGEDERLGSFHVYHKFKFSWPHDWRALRERAQHTRS